MFDKKVLITKFYINSYCKKLKKQIELLRGRVILKYQKKVQVHEITASFKIENPFCNKIFF